MNLKRLNILLADDDTDDCMFFKQALEEISIPTDLTIVKDGGQLMNYLSENIERLPSVLFLDINMPRKNGVECLSEINQNKKLKDLPIVMFSTTNSQDAISLVFKNGAHVYIRKPNYFTKLKQIIHYALPIAVEKIFSNTFIKYILNA